MSSNQYLRKLPINRECTLPPGLNLTVNGKLTATNVVTTDLSVTNPPNIIVTLDSLTDATITTPSTNQVVKYNGSQWVNSAASTIPVTLDALSDVVITAPATNQVLEYNGAYWVNADPSNFLSLDNLSDVTITAPSTGQTVSYNGSQWVNVYPSTLPISLDNLSDVTITTPSNAQLVRYNGTTWVNSKSAVSEQSDATITTPSSGQVLKYNGTSWINSNASTIPLSLDNLSDVAITAPSTSQVVRYNGSSWLNSALASSDLSDYSTSIYTAYTPTITNLTASWTITSTDCKYTRYGTSVIVVGYFLVHSTSFNTVASQGFNITIPVPRTGNVDFPDNHQIKGYATSAPVLLTGDFWGVAQVYSSTNAGQKVAISMINFDSTNSYDFRINTMFQYES